MSGANGKYIEFMQPNKVRLLKFKSNVARIIFSIDAVYLPSWIDNIEHIIISLHTDDSSPSKMSMLKIGADLLDVYYEFPYLYLESRTTYFLGVTVNTSPYYDFDGTLV